MRPYRRNRGGARGEKAFGIVVHLLKPAAQIRHEVRHVHIHEGRQPGKALRRLRQLVGLRVAHHLDAVFHQPVRGIVIGQARSNLGRYPALFGQHRQPLYRAAHLQIRIASACD